MAQCSEKPPTTNQVQTIELAEFEGIVSDKGYRGLVVVMASWCPPCREELPILEKLHLEYRDKGIQIVAISVDEEGPKAVQPMIDKLKISFPVYWVGRKAVRHYGISGIPTTMIYSQGGLIAKLPGSHPRRIIEKTIQALMSDGK